MTLLPSATEIVCALGLDRNLVGVSHSCNFPANMQQLPAMTSTHVPYQKDSETIDRFVREHLTGHEALYDLDMDMLREAQPDVIISQTLCDVCAVSTGDVLAALQSLPTKPTLIDLEPNTLNDVFDDILNVGDQLGAGKKANQVVASLMARCDAAAERTATVPASSRPRVAFLEWLHPPFNGGHWNPELVELAGGVDLLGAPGKPSSTLDWETVVAADPDVIYIACCGFRIERAQIDVAALSDNPVWRDLRAVQNDRVYISDGNAYFSCPGPRLIDGMEIMARALHPQIH